MIKCLCVLYSDTGRHTGNTSPPIGFVEPGEAAAGELEMLVGWPPRQPSCNTRDKTRVLRSQPIQGWDDVAAFVHGVNRDECLQILPLNVSRHCVLPWLVSLMVRFTHVVTAVLWMDGPAVVGLPRVVFLRSNGHLQWSSVPCHQQGACRPGIRREPGACGTRCLPCRSCNLGRSGRCAI